MLWLGALCESLGARRGCLRVYILCSSLLVQSAHTNATQRTAPHVHSFKLFDIFRVFNLAAVPCTVCCVLYAVYYFPLASSPARRPPSHCFALSSLARLDFTFTLYSLVAFTTRHNAELCRFFGTVRGWHEKARCFFRAVFFKIYASDVIAIFIVYSSWLIIFLATLAYLPLPIRVYSAARHGATFLKFRVLSSAHIWCHLFRWTLSTCNVRQSACI